MAFENIVNVCVTRPNFSLMRRCFEEYRSDNAPCKGGAANQCAVRMSVAMGRCGFGLESFPDRRRVHRGRRSCHCDVPHVLGAEELERFLRLSLGETFRFSRHDLRHPERVLECLHGSTGILYFNDIFRRDDHSAGDHIDLFDGERCYNEILRTTPGGRTSTRTISFFERANRVSFFRLD